MTKADKAFKRADYLKAYSLYQDYLKADSTNYQVVYKSGLCLFNINKTDSLAYRRFFKIRAQVPEAHFYLGRILQMNENTEKALEEFYTYILTKNRNKESFPDSVVKQEIQKCERAIVERRQRDFFVVRNIGNKINTSFPEYVPLIWTLNGNLVFTSRRSDSKGGQIDAYGRYYEDIYISAKKDSTLEAPVPLSDSLNSPGHDACVAFSPDGNELIIYRTDETKLAGDLYMSRYKNNTWTAPVKLGSEVNSEYLETSACFSAYGNEIVFSSNRPGGYGGRDLYRVVKFLNGEYSLPVNLGPEINSQEDEDAPFLDFNNNTLYFSSKGHQTMGEYDIFMAEFDTGKDRWKHPVNMGQPVNSSNDDIYFVKQKDQAKGYFSSRREGGYGDADLYEVDFSGSTAMIAYCRILPADSGKLDPGEINVSLYDLKTGKLEGSYKPNPESGNMIILATKDHRYQLKVESGTYQVLTQEVSFNDKNKELILYLNKQ